MTQNTQLIHYMRSNFITPLDALRLCGCLNFGARICEIRKMYELKEMWTTVGKKQKRVKAFKIKGTK
jgi:hypothetical protein